MSPSLPLLSLPTPSLPLTPFHQPPYPKNKTRPNKNPTQVLTALEEAITRGDIPSDAVTEAALRGFLSEYGRQFYGVAPATRQIRLTRDGARVEESLRGEGVEIVPFRAGELTWGVEWL